MSTNEAEILLFLFENVEIVKMLFKIHLTIASTNKIFFQRN